jgi:hypothetical protein
MAMMPHRRLLYTIILIALLVLLCTFTATNAYFGYLGNLSGNGGPLMFTFFTNDTTILLGFSSLLYVIYSIRLYRKNLPIPPFLKTIRHLTITMTMGAVLVVVFFLAPWYASSRGPLAYFSLFGFPINIS